MAVLPSRLIWHVRATHHAVVWHYSTFAASFREWMRREWTSRIAPIAGGHPVIYEFGTFRLDSVRETLTGANGPVALRDHALRVLILLVERAPEVLGKDEILTHVWGHDALSESSIPQVIKDIRQALGDPAKSPKLIVTRYGRGYQFVAQVGRAEAPAIVGTRRWRRWLLPIGVAGVLLVCALFWMGLRDRPVPADDSPKWLIRAIDTKGDESLSRPFAEYLEFVVRSAAGDSRIGFAKTDEVVPGARYIDVGLAVSEKDPEQRFSLTLGETVAGALPTATAYARSSPMVKDSIERIFRSIEFSPESNIESGVISQSAFATETLLRGMAAQFDGDTGRAIALFEACLAEDENFDFARYELSIALRREGDYQRALALLKTLETRHQSDFWLYRINNAKGIAYWRLGRYAEADASFTSALQHNHSNESRVIMGTNLAILRRDQGQFDAAEASALDAIKHSDPDKHPSTSAGALNTWASILMRSGRVGQAIEPLTKARDLFQGMGNRAGHASVLSRIGDVHERLGNGHEAELAFRQAAAIREQLGDTLGLAASRLDLARLARRRGEFDESRTLARLGLEAAASKNDVHLVIQSHANLAALELAGRHYADAQTHALEALRLAEQRSEPELILQARYAVLAIDLDAMSGDGIEQQDDLSVRVDALLDDAGKAENQSLIAQSRLLRGRLFSTRADLSTARAEFEATAKLASTIGSHELQVDALLELARLDLDGDSSSTTRRLAEAEKLEPPSYPYLVLLARSLHAQGKPQKALALAFEAKQKSGDWWSAEDEALLDSWITNASPHP